MYQYMVVARITSKTSMSVEEQENPLLNISSGVEAVHHVKLHRSSLVACGSAFMTGINANLRFDALQGRIERKFFIREEPARVPASLIMSKARHFLLLTSQIQYGFAPARSPVI
jgi:hypothetical protein